MPSSFIYPESQKLDQLSQMRKNKFKDSKQLKAKWLKLHELVRERVQSRHKSSFERLRESIDPKMLTAGLVGSVTLLMTPLPSIMASPLDLVHLASQHNKNDLDPTEYLTQLKTVTPTGSNDLSKDQELVAEKLLSKQLGFTVKAELDGKRLNRTFGSMGAEQHLYRFPGDTLEQHVLKPEDREMYLPSGIAPGLGAWGYFAPSKAGMTEQDMMNERYYLAVQTFLVPDYNERVGEYRDFFRFRKMVVVNPQTGQACVAVIGDAGPAPWTGKHLGGSPEVMEATGLAEGPRKGGVIYMFVDDPQNKIPLGPIDMKEAIT